MTVREILEQREISMLSEFACKSVNTKGRVHPSEKCQIRTEFQRDRDKIIHCKAFRRLKHKTQVFLSPEGDHYRTRLTHTLEVAQIGRTIARALMLNEDLVEAIALGHDLGHTPFGHAGEVVLNKIVPGGFSHNEQSLRVADKLENDYKGLNLTYEVRDGILNHTGKGCPCTLEGKIIQFSDRIAYINHDIDDAVRAGILADSDIPKEIRSVLGESHGKRIDTLIKSVITASAGINDIQMGSEEFEAADALRDFMFDNVYKNPIAKNEESKVDGLITMLYEHLLHNTDKLPPEFRDRINIDGAERVVCDYVAGMSDRYAITCYNNFFVPNMWQY